MGKKLKFLKASADYFEGGFSMVDDNLPDGAWFQVHIDTAEHLMKSCPADLGLTIPKNVDSHDIVQHYLSYVPND